MPLELPPLYAIVDPEQTRGRPAERLLTSLLEAGVTILQLRVKSLPPADFLELAKQARAITRAHHCRLIINDRVDVALSCDADGVHLGQDDLPLAAARKLMRDKIVGISTHDLEQARAAERDGADYIGFGPMFGTRTKATVYEPRGPEMLQQIRSAVKLPIVAIGGITERNVQNVWQAGADSVAIISDILQDENPGTKASGILNQGRTVSAATENMTFDHPPEDRYFEDYVPGTVHEFGLITVDEQEVIEFGKRYVPLSYHVDKEAAQKSIYGGLIASGWQTAALMMRIYTENYLSHVANLGSPGGDELRWNKPVFPGDQLSVRATVMEARRSESRPDRGIVRTFIEVLNQSRDVVMSMKMVNFVKCRNL